jgi:hypothetical protein
MSVSKELQNRKRKLENKSDDEEEEERKKKILLDLELSDKVDLLQLADELLVEITRRLDGESLYNLSL